MKEQYDKELEKQEQAELDKKYTNKTRDDKKKNEQEINKKEVEDFNERMKKHKVGSFGGIIELCKELYKNKPKRDEMKEVTKKDILALILTIIVLILIGIILWFIPFTNGWMRELLFENPLFNAIASLFQK